MPRKSKAPITKATDLTGLTEAELLIRELYIKQEKTSDICRRVKDELDESVTPRDVYALVSRMHLKDFRDTLASNLETEFQLERAREVKEEQFEDGSKLRRVAVKALDNIEEEAETRGKVSTRDLTQVASSLKASQSIVNKALGLDKPSGGQGGTTVNIQTIINPWNRTTENPFAKPDENEDIDI